jgi:hypothetical protein
MASRSSSRSRVFDTPMEDPMLAGFTKIGNGSTDASCAA